MLCAYPHVHAHMDEQRAHVPIHNSDQGSAFCLRTPIGSKHCGTCAVETFVVQTKTFSLHMDIHTESVQTLMDLRR